MNIVEMVKNSKFGGALHGFGMKLEQASPEIMMVSGLTTLLVGTIYACMKTEKAKKVVEETKEKAKEIETKFVIDAPEGMEVHPETIKYVKNERGRQYLKLYGHTAYELAKIYGIPALLWMSGAGMLIGSHGMLRKINQGLAADIFAGNQLLQEYRNRVKHAVGDEIENKIYLGAQEGMVNIIETDPETGKDTVRQEKADVFYAQPGSIFARNFTEGTTDIMYRSFTDEFLDRRVDMINKDLELGLARAYNGLEIYRKLGLNENALGEGEVIDQLLRNGISGNARKVPDPEMRKLKITRLRGYEEVFDPERKTTVYRPCLRIDPNFYPLEGKI